MEGRAPRRGSAKLNTHRSNSVPQSNIRKDPLRHPIHPPPHPHRRPRSRGIPSPGICLQFRPLQIPDLFFFVGFIKKQCKTKLSCPCKLARHEAGERQSPPLFLPNLNKTGDRERVEKVKAPFNARGCVDERSSLCSVVRREKKNLDLFKGFFF